MVLSMGFLLQSSTPKELLRWAIIVVRMDLSLPHYPIPNLCSQSREKIRFGQLESAKANAIFLPSAATQRLRSAALLHWMPPVDAYDRLIEVKWRSEEDYSRIRTTFCI